MSGPFRRALWVAAAAAAVAAAQTARWSATMQSGLADAMQLSLGGSFGDGPAFQNRVTITRTGLSHSRDSLQFYGWTTTDLRSGALDTDVGIRYRVPVRRFRRTNLVAGAGLEHWNFPSVLGGTRDIVLDTYASWAGGERMPWSVSANGKTLLRSDLPRGTFLCVQANYTNRLLKLGSRSLIVQHGPVYVYSWGLYGRSGHRVLRYAAAVQFGDNKWGAEFLMRPQIGLQPGIPDGRYWTAGLVRRFSL